MCNMRDICVQSMLIVPGCLQLEQNVHCCYSLLLAGLVVDVEVKAPYLPTIVGVRDHVSQSMAFPLVHCVCTSLTTTHIFT